jgi:hypothetical protein
MAMPKCADDPVPELVQFGRSFSACVRVNEIVPSGEVMA